MTAALFKIQKKIIQSKIAIRFLRSRNSRNVRSRNSRHHLCRHTAITRLSRHYRCFWKVVVAPPLPLRCEKWRPGVHGVREVSITPHFEFWPLEVHHPGTCGALCFATVATGTALHPQPKCLKCKSADFGTHHWCLLWTKHFFAKLYLFIFIFV